ncbi:MAG: hypothetical protein GOVbin3530_58 [Prokaryotic dsDNA virus sp.]|jgi:hypothetical protein|nr:MAG: hypothetical protein GOVbin3530_58 [Prokaryotic dsDNA virus sp.]|tara:strand:+ start:5238 stop:5486 length:249 start_codon:yes stop_codon:yes gene_type:complete
MDDEEMVYKAMINSYNLIIKDIYIDVKNILEDGWFAHDINNPLKREVLENMLQYFMDIEDYEKCQDIKNMLDNWTKNKYRKI